MVQLKLSYFCFYFVFRNIQNFIQSSQINYTLQDFWIFIKQNLQVREKMIKKKLQPLKKPGNFTEAGSNDQVIIECLSQLIRQQRKTNELLMRNFNVQQSHHQQVISSPTRPLKLDNSQINNGNILRGEKIISLENSLRNGGSGQKSSQNKLRKSDFIEKLPITTFVQQSQKILKQALTKKLHTDQKKNYNVINEMLPYTDRRELKVLVSFDQVAKQFPLIITPQILQKITVNWIGDVYRLVASMCWNMMLNGFLTFEQTKILFTQNIIYNYIEFMNELQRRDFNQYKNRLTSLINKKSISILDFLGKQYPQTKVQVPNIRLKEIIPNTNNSTRLKFDIITIANRKQNLQFRFKQNGNYSIEIMSLINFVIEQTNQSYSEYEKQCFHIFEQIFIMPQKRAKPQDGNNFLKQKLNEKSQTTEDIIYREKVKKYTKFLIGRKINKNVPKYTREEINNGVFFPKSPSILRIITKWVEQLTEIIKHPEKHIFSADRQLKSHDGNFVVLFGTVRKAICDKIIQNRDALFKKIQSIKQECFYIESILSSTNYTVDSTQSHLSLDQISVGKFSVCLQKAISSYIFQELNEILHFLLKVPLDVDQTNIGIKEDFYQSEVRKQLDKLNLVTFKIFDLLRCKCISNEEEIIWIMKYLMERNLVEDFKLVRVKDRLSQGTRDINCNIRFKKGSLLSEMQLSVVSNYQSKQEKLDSYNHFLYELKRSKLGPISENVSIWTVLEQRSLYFQNISRNKIPKEPVFHSCSNQHLQKFVRPICCDSCNNFYPFPETVYSNVRCSKCRKTYCGQCYSIVLSQQDKKSMIFQGLFKQPILQHIIQHKDYTKSFPLQGVYFKRYHQRRQMNFFTVLIKNRQTKESVSYETMRQISKNKKQVECDIIFTHNAIRNGKPVQKQKNPNTIIKAVFKNQNQLYIDKADYKFFDQYLVFSFDNKFIPSTMTLDQIETFLKNQQNHKIKVYNIMEDPVYVDDMHALKKKSQKLRELYKLKLMFQTNLQQKFLVYQFKSILIVAKVFKDSYGLGYAINYANNISEIKSYATQQKSIVSMEKHGLKNEFQNLQAQIHPKIFENLCKNLRKVYLNYNSMESIQGLKDFVQLEVLYLRHNLLKNLKGLQGMKELMVLRFDDNKVQDLQPLKGLIGLKRLMGNDNKIKSVQPLRDLVQLKTIEFDMNLISSLQPVKDLPQLQDLNFKKTSALISLPVFASKDLKSVSLSQTGIKDFQILSNYPKIRRLMLQGLGLASIPSFIKKLKLNQLWLGDNQITQIQNIQDQYELQILSLKNNKIKQVKNLQQVDAIRTIYLDKNHITSLEGIKYCLETLKFLSIKQNPLDDVKEIIYADEKFKFQYTRQSLTEKANKYLDELYTNKVNSSGSDD